jgi:flagellar biosynthetic protein FliO
MSSLLLAQSLTPVLADGPGLWRSVLAVAVVFGLLAGCVWLVRRGGLDALGRRGPRAVHIETAVPLGDRRQLVVVSVEGRRLLLGLTAAQVTLITELAGAPQTFASTLDTRLSVESQD